MRTRKSFFNMLSNFIPNLILPIFAMIKLNMLLSTYGIDLYGMNLYLTQIMGYLNLVEGGFGYAFVQSLYKPLAENNRKKVQELYQGACYILKFVGSIIGILSIGILFILPLLLKTPIDMTLVRSVFIIMVIPTIVDYFLMAPTLVLQANQEEYKVNIIKNIFQFIRVFTHLFVIYQEFDFIWIAVTESFYIIFQIAIIRRLVFKNYPWLKEKQNKDLSTLEKTKQVFAHRLSGVVLSSTDNIILGAVVGTAATAVYGNYQYITTQLQKIIESIINAPTASFGNLFANQDERSYDIFKEFFTFTIFISSLIAIPLMISINAFIAIWQNKAMVLPVVDVFLFVMILFYILTRQPIMVVRNTNGLFKESKKYAYFEAICNLSLSLMLVKPFGITGVLGATLLTFCVSDLWLNSKLVYNKVFKKNIIQYYILYFPKIIILCIVYCIMQFVWNSFLVTHISGYITWFIFAGFIFLLGVILLGSIYLLLFPDFKLFVNRCIALIQKKGKEQV